ncbi:MAG: spore coat protein U-like protein [Limimaricola cinnabarinus]|jgi:spore coat protein U-like protein|uniref:Csu type fimbrial protein n=1 Tax=Limimaricola cinnabarinus TaxID=1125964 RepID=UPI0039E70117
MKPFAQRLVQLIGCVTAAALGPGTASAAIETAKLNVTATVADTCSVEVTPLDFSLLKVGAPTEEAAAGTVSIICSADKSAMSVFLDGGTFAISGQRRMKSDAGTHVPYEIYSNAARTAPLSISDALFSGSILATAPQLFQIYGRVPAGQYSAGTYSDTISVTVNY